MSILPMDKKDRDLKVEKSILMLDKFKDTLQARCTSKEEAIANFNKLLEVDYRQIVQGMGCYIESKIHPQGYDEQMRFEAVKCFFTGVFNRLSDRDRYLINPWDYIYSYGQNSSSVYPAFHWSRMDEYHVYVNSGSCYIVGLPKGLFRCIEAVRAEKEDSYEFYYRFWGLMRHPYSYLSQPSIPYSLISEQDYSSLPEDFRKSLPYQIIGKNLYIEGDTEKLLAIRESSYHFCLSGEQMYRLLSYDIKIWGLSIKEFLCYDIEIKW